MIMEFTFLYRYCSFASTFVDAQWRQFGITFPCPLPHFYFIKKTMDHILLLSLNSIIVLVSYLMDGETTAETDARKTQTVQIDPISRIHSLQKTGNFFAMTSILARSLPTFQVPRAQQRTLELTLQMVILDPPRTYNQTGLLQRGFRLIFTVNLEIGKKGPAHITHGVQLTQMNGAY